MNDHLEDMIATLEALGNIRIEHRSQKFADQMGGIEPWYVSFKNSVDIGNGATLTSPHGNGRSPEEAIENFFTIMTNIEDDEVVVVHFGGNRIHYVFDGRQFKVEEVKADV